MSDNQRPDTAAAMSAVADYNSIVLRRMVPELVAYIERQDALLNEAAGFVNEQLRRGRTDEVRGPADLEARLRAASEPN